MVPAAYIIGNGEYHIGEGSTISLVCIIENVSEQQHKQIEVLLSLHVWKKRIKDKLYPLIQVMFWAKKIPDL